METNMTQHGTGTTTGHIFEKYDRRTREIDCAHRRVAMYKRIKAHSN